MKRLIYCVVALLMLQLVAVHVFAQKKPLDHSTYKIWKTIGGHQLTSDGRYAMYYANVEEGDGTLNIVDLKTSETLTIQRGVKAKITSDDKYACFVIRPTRESLKEAKKKKVKEALQPKDTLCIMDIVSKKRTLIPNLESYTLASEGSAYIAYEVSATADTAKAKAGKKAKVKKEKGEGSDLIIRCLKSGAEDTLRYVSEFSFNKKGDKLWLTRVPNSKDTATKAGVYVYSIPSKTYQPLLEGDIKAQYFKPVASDNERMLAFYANTDTTKKVDENVEIYVYDFTGNTTRKIAFNGMEGLSEGWRISRNRSLNFSPDCSRLFFGIAPILPQKDTSLVDSEQAKLDVWHWNDTYIQTLQKRNVGRELRRSYQCYKSLNEDTPFVQLATDSYPIVRVPKEWGAEWGYSISDEAYAYQSQWDANPKNDLYIISLKDGSAKKIQDGEYISNLEESPDGKYLTWYNNEEKQWYAYCAADGTIRNISKEIPTPLWRELHDTPQMAGSYGNGGWMKNDEAFFIYDKYDVWQVDPVGAQKPFMVTDGAGRKQHTEFRILRTDAIQLPAGTPGIKKEPLVKGEPIFFTAFDYTTKGYGYFKKETKGKKQQLASLIMEPNYSLGYFNKSKKGNVITFVKSSFSVSPDLWVTKDMFKTAKRLSDINPQQKEYNWGTCELVKWKSRDGRELEGLLYKPEDFDSTKKYPMISYFYEKTSQYRNLYRNPAPSRSTINITYFTSNGYLVFMPDIHYRDGYPGQSAMDCIIPGVEELCKNSWVDRDNLGIQGQSWGGYQTAYIVTQTDMFKAAGAGAPVANMTSAYGGIRWGQGVVRQFQYEHTQSRIGKTLWDKGGLELYIQNSPLFFVDKMKTPLLIMNNDNDGAVPWYQGIELFTAMRRLGKVGWMLQYNDEEHNISKYVNAVDYTIRLSQFFDHYLKGQPMPVWMKDGVPATKKGIDWGLDLVK